MSTKLQPGNSVKCEKMPCMRNLQNLTTPISHAQDKDREEKWGPPQNWDLHDMERRVRHMWKEGAQNHMDDRPRSQE